MEQLPCHFVWSDGRVSATLDDLLADADDDRDQVAWHLEQGHLQAALLDQGYRQIVDGLEAVKSGEERVELLLQRLAIFHAMHRRWQVVSDFRAYVGRVDKLFRARSAGLLPSVCKKLADTLGDLAEAVCSVEDADTMEDEDDDAAPPRAKAAGGRKPAKKKSKQERAAKKERLAEDTKRIAKAAKDARGLQG